MRFVYMVDKEEKKNTNKLEKIEKILRVFVILFLFIDIIFFFTAKISYKINNDEEQMIESNFTPYSEIKWHEKYNLVAHAMGGIDNESYTSSREAFKKSYENGLRIFEIDFALTSDKKIVATHEWENNKPLTYQEFMVKKVKGKYEPLDLTKTLNILKEYKDIYLITDFKDTETKEVIQLQINEIVKSAKEIDEKILDRIIIQIYTKEMYEWVNSIYKFDNYIYTLYKNEDTTKEILDFVKNKNIDIITCKEDRLSDELIKGIKELNKGIFIHTINDVGKYKELIEKGVSGIYTDFLNTNKILNR